LREDGLFIEMDIEELNKQAILIEDKINDPGFKRLIEHVLTNIPNDYTEDFPSFSVHEGPVREGAKVMDGDIAIVIFDIPKLTHGWNRGSEVGLKI
jgi:hypothetical protein